MEIEETNVSLTLVHGTVVNLSFSLYKICTSYRIYLWAFILRPDSPFPLLLNGFFEVMARQG